MARFEDTPDLFGRGVGQGTSGNISCGWCGTRFGGRENKKGEADPHNDSILFTDFGTKQICDCCFGEVEDAVLSRMGDIVPWFIRILQRRREVLASLEQMLADLRQALATEAAAVH